jgi:hypothetical protein
LISGLGRTQNGRTKEDCGYGFSPPWFTLPTELASQLRRSKHMLNPDLAEAGSIVGTIFGYWLRHAILTCSEIVRSTSSIGTESIIVVPLPKVFWLTSERKYVWYQCGTSSHFCLVGKQEVIQNGFEEGEQISRRVTSNAGELKGTRHYRPPAVARKRPESWFQPYRKWLRGSDLN